MMCENTQKCTFIKHTKHTHTHSGGIPDTIVIVVGNGLGDPSSNLGQGCWHFI